MAGTISLSSITNLNDNTGGITISTITNHGIDFKVNNNTTALSISNTGEVTIPTMAASSAWTGSTIGVAKGGTGATTLTANAVILGNGTDAVQAVAPGTAGQVLTSNGSSSAPTWNTLNALPSQTGNTGKFLTTDGTTASWTTISASWTIKSSAYTAAAGDMILADSTAAAFTITLPASPVAGNQIIIADAGGTFNTKNVTVGRNGSNILGLAQDLVLNIANEKVTIVYYNATRGWILA
jgi:hypothetical protein